MSSRAGRTDILTTAEAATRGDLKDFVRCGFEIGWRKGALQTLRWSDVTNDVSYLRAKNSKGRKPKTVPLEGELRDIVDRRRAARVWQAKPGSHTSPSSSFTTKVNSGDFRKAWATACCGAGVGNQICRKCDAYVNAKYKCSGCGRQWKRDDVR